MKTTELAVMMRGIAPVIREHVASALAVFTSRLEALEQRAMVPGPQGERGLIGDRGPQGERGEKGIDGRDGERGEKGEKGEPGERGERGPEGPQGIAGRDGLPGSAGRDGLPGMLGEKGIDGKNGRDGIDGKDGRDGVGFDGLDEMLEDGGRHLVRRYLLGDQVVREFRHQTATVIHRGVWKDERGYERGDTVTWGGSMFHCDERTDPGEKPEVSRKWTLAVKRGRDGREKGKL